MNTMELCTKNPNAYEALPEAYQGDDCLYFYEDKGMLFCRPAEGQEGALGQWVAKYSESEKCWKHFA